MNPPATRRALQEAALRLFRRDGYAATTAAAIAEEAGLTERTFYRYFATKAEAFYDDADMELATFLEAIRAHASEVGLEGATAALRDFAEIEAASPHRLRDRWDIINSDRDLRREWPLEAWEEAVASELASAHGRDRTNHADRILACATVRMLLETVETWSAAGSTRSLPEVADEVIDAAGEALRMRG